MDTGVLFYKIDPPYIHEDPVRGEYYIYCAVPHIRNYVVRGRSFQYPIRTAYFNPDAPYDFPLSWLHPGGPGIPHPEEQMPPPPDYPPPPEPPLADEPIPTQHIHEAPPAPFVLDEWGVPVLPPELDPLLEPIEPPVFDEQQGHEYDQIMEAPPPSPDCLLFSSYPFMVPVASSGSSAITLAEEEDEEE
ncbi:leucine-rich repeat extensin-like protein 6 [Arachis ipaensis]|uniref:leucine-rich repeat extensin-like protein 6 n=1 Tax=Arachis ipaensis TaxID=130454 RepID=UPI0007AFA1E8|nr:leucine-rich repeat extensin-like protein 6 [Arachis ipaensis]XP_025661556.1 leucine-rich repeat extensin-like protein 6 [Arachis hypogaea]